MRLNHSTLLLASLSLVLIADRSNGQAILTPSQLPPTTVEDTAQGWIWDHMFECDTANSTVASAHAGEPGSSGTYIFSGTGIIVFSGSDVTISVHNSLHRCSKLRITIDGKRIGDYAENTTDQSANTPLVNVHNLVDKTHSLVVEPIGGWASVSSIIIDHTAPKVDVAPLDLLVGNKAIPPGVYRVCPRISPTIGLDVIAASSTDGTGLQLYNYVKQSNQQFRIVSAGQGKYVFQPVFAPYSAISVLPATSDSPAQVGIWQYMSNAAQIWMLSETPSGYCRLTPSSVPGTALTVSQQQNSLSLQTSNGSVAQDWEIIPAGEDK